MSRPRFLADHDFNEHIIDSLARREPAIEMVRARQHNLDAQPDTVLLGFAAASGFLVLSHDVNTMPAAAYTRIESGMPMPGLLMVRQTDPIASVVDSLLLIWAASEAEEWNGQVWFLPI